MRWFWSSDSTERHYVPTVEKDSLGTMEEHEPAAANGYIDKRGIGDVPLE